MKRVALSALQAFERTVRFGSQRAAAEALGVTPTAVSHAVRQLEARYGVVLLRPDGRGVRPTALGERLGARLHAAFDEIDDALDELSQAETKATVSVTPGFAALWLAPRLARAAALGRPVSMRIDATVVRTDPDRRHGPDMAVRYAAAADGERLAEESFLAFESPSMTAWREPSPVFFETRWRHDIGPAPTWRNWFDAAGTAMPDGARVVVFDDEHLAVQSALAGAGRVLASSVLAADLARTGLLRAWRPQVRLAGLSYWLITPKTRRLPRGAETVRAALRDWFSEDRGQVGAS
ncbi:hypothetical protein CCR85_03955 [Rhodothalassium salexigens]|uniref:LysR family transcriptional regulator n=1 Tax=Rhodothalassium salexigens TaxID=1086 RepID=UPI001912B2FC|nr:LysR family transcriptional regulator [Rhodothalassium salexigens]MBK5910646.1 hypothetical protein [Rhodothalassium salexigens]MBK5920581.1 hypothetical protein [Rhodothalassium salexigens]